MLTLFYTFISCRQGSSKAAIIALTKGAAFDLADHGIRVNSIAYVRFPSHGVPLAKRRVSPCMCSTYGVRVVDRHPLQWFHKALTSADAEEHPG